jgi:hypothetical protein
MIDRPEWREALLLLGGILYRQGLEKVDGLISAALGKLGEQAWLPDQARYAGLLRSMVRDLRPLNYQPADTRYQQTMDALLDIFGAAYGIEFSERLEAAESLGQAGDPGLRKDNWITIEGGGQGNLKPFHIARYPVTAEEYRRIMEDEGYQNERWWQAGGFAGKNKPEYWDEQVQHPS